MSILWKYLDKTNAAIEALKDYGSMQFIIESTDTRIKQEQSKMEGLASPNMDGMPHMHNPKAGEDRIVNGIEEIDILKERYRQAVILNGDKVFLTLGEGGVLAHGNPWNGSSPYKVNGYTRLRGIIALDQAPTNTIRPLNDMEVMSLYVPHIFMPLWDARLTETAMETLGQMLPLVPVYAMSCRPDEEAVALAERTVFGGQS